MSNLKRTSIRCNMSRKRDKEVWELLHNLTDTGYSSSQEFIHDALLHYYNWVLEGRVPYLRSEMEAEFKRWMGEVLTAKGVSISSEGTAGASGSPPGKMEEQAIKPKVAEIEEDAMNRAYDFLSTL